VIAYSVNDDGTPEETEIKASDGWALKFVAVGKLGVISITASADTEDADDFIFTALAATTAAYVVGDYQWQLVATKSTNRYTIAVGRVTLIDNIAGRSALYDNRSHAKKVLDAIEAVLEGRATRQDQAYTIAGRSLSLTPIPDLIKLRSVYKREYEGELAAANIKAGRGSGRKILTRFVNPR
jgi:hypothetical protein